MKKSLAIVLMLLAFAAVVVATTTLKRDIPVQSCSDTDGGVNQNITGNVTFTTFGNVTRTVTDFCIDNVTVAELACNFQGNLSVQLWEVDCSRFGKICIGGSCV